MKQFSYHEPQTIDAACALLAELGPGAGVLAGGTDLIPKMKQRVIEPKHIVNLKSIPDLDFIRRYGDRGLHIGALTKIADLEASSVIQERFPLLFASASVIGSRQIRNLATIGGNLCNAAPSADMAPGLLVMNAKVVIAGVEGTRTMELEDFFLGPGNVNLRRGEILQEIVVPYPPLDAKQVYIKHSPRRAMDLAVVSVAVCLTLDENRDTCQDVRIALGAVAPTPVRAHETEATIVGKRLSEIDWRIVSDNIRREVTPISDVRGSAEYRSEMVGTLTVQAFRRLWSGEPTDE